MSILNQPFQGQLGNVLIDQLEKDYTSLTIFSAFAKNSGVLRLKPALEDFKINGGKISAFIGIDLDGTSYEALLNLFSLCDSLYVIHSENMSTTYHSKIYLLENDKTAWCAIGSNNLTGGGLWTNFESCFIQNFALPSQAVELENIYSIVAKYSDSDYPCSAQIASVNDINILLEENYITKEVPQRISSIKRSRSEKADCIKNHPFGSEKVVIPTLITKQRARKPFSKPDAEMQQNADYIIDIPTSTPAFTNEQFWFEMRKSTGGSRNILDLSMIGQIQSGSVAGTPYECPDPTRMYGGVKFFEITPTDTSCEKDITINYLGKDYFPSTIKFAPDNGSWRIQLKGTPNDGTDELSKYGNRGDFVQKILFFEKITPDYYVLSLLDDSELDTIKTLSRVWARNGNNSSSKAYGML
ncbi:MAG: phospholipase D family protein [Lachnospiraceae bacterium]|nr:phospholipase D family protein [Lachnospiraceae bacterium]MDE7203550.1 phospholipase D family protein [Lachnospiraceae bacterium]